MAEKIITLVKSFITGNYSCVEFQSEIMSKDWVRFTLIMCSEKVEQALLELEILLDKELLTLGKYNINNEYEQIEESNEIINPILLIIDVISVENETKETNLKKEDVPEKSTPYRHFYFYIIIIFIVVLSISMHYGQKQNAPFKPF